VRAWSGWSYSFDPRKPPGQRLISVRHHGENIVLDRTYRVVVRAASCPVCLRTGRLLTRTRAQITEYMRGGGDGFDSLKRGTAIKTSDLKISEVLARYLIAKKEIAPVLEDRVVYIH
jgi:hypothetical protein